MELRISGHEVLLALHPTYSSADDSALLQQLSRFKPLVDYLTKFRPTEFTIAAMTVRNTTLIAQRVASVTVDVALTGAARETVTQTVTLTEDAAAVILPVIRVGDVRHAVLMSAPCIAAGGDVVPVAPFGSFDKSGAFCGAAAPLLAKAGLAVSEKNCTPLSTEDLQFGDEGLGLVRVLQAASVLTASEFEELLRDPQRMADGNASLTIVPLGDVASVSRDLRAIVAAQLALKQ